ncbi:hypothetical protein [Burkholderia sp. USMB20]|uniref:hypothetical protein n=2 Tax=Burkholderia TaxID=32008 RepID=UPI0010EC3FB0|nr:hypothetical protein [Burkholderia sp. USMB20]TGN94402.1 hypothetical protein PL79_026610 [Burkholderia sp. USMB20]
MARHIPPPPPRGAITPAVALARDAFGREIVDGSGSGDPGRQDGALPQAMPAGGAAPAAPGGSAPPKEKATDAIGRRAAALADAIDFPTFVASLVHGTYDAIVDSSIKQVESFADLVGAVAKPLDQFTQENVTDGQARAWLVEQYPHDVTLTQDGGDYRLAPVVRPGDDDAAPAPAWLADFGAADGAFDTQTLESVVLPRARERVAQHRLSTLSTMVLLGMQRVVVKDGTIAASLNFQAKARDRAAVQYATSNDPSSGQTTWGGRGTSGDVVTTVSTVAVNAQTDTDLKATLTGKVSINFASETLPPLDRFVDEASRNLLERHSRPARGSRRRPPSRAPVAVPVPPRDAGAAAVPRVPAASAAPSAASASSASSASSAPAAPAPASAERTHMIAPRPLGETLGAFADVAGQLAAGAAQGLRVRSMAMELPLDLRIAWGADGIELVGDLPQFLTRTAFDAEPARLAIVLEAVPVDGAVR